MDDKSMKIGILFSLTGCTAVTESGQCRSALLAIQQINDAGGIHGMPIEPFVEDVASDPLFAKAKAKYLIEKENVRILIGPYTSACRKAVIPILKQYNVLLFYPTLYEGNEQNKWIYYTGALPNQQLQFFIPWIISQLGMSFYLVGSDYIFPRMTNKHMHELLNINGGRVIGEAYTPLGTQNYEHILKDIERLKPDIVFSTLIGDSAVAFYEQFHRYGFEQPLCSPITAETEIQAMDIAGYNQNIFSSFPYFKTVDSAANHAFIEAYKKRYRSDTISSVMQNTYNSIYLLSDALKKTRQLNIDSIRRALNSAAFDSPQGYIRFDENNHHLWQCARIGHVTERGDFEVVWESNDLIAPTPFMSYAASNLPFRISDLTANRFENRVITDEQLGTRQERWEHYMPFLNRLPSYYPYQFFLFDSDGILIERIDNPRFVWNRKGVELGTKWSVDARGKNGFGLALFGKRDSIVQGKQHDCPYLNESVTAGIPIMNGKNCIGVLGILAGLDDYSGLSSQIQAFKLFTDTFVQFIRMEQKKNLFERTLKEATNQTSEGVLVVNDEKILFANELADYLIDKKPSLIQLLMHQLENLDSTREKQLRKKVENEVFDIRLQRRMDACLIYIKPINGGQTQQANGAARMTFQDIIGLNEKFLNTIAMAKIAANTDANVLIIGESGTGKELFANAVHNESSRGKKPFIAVNCGAISKELIYSELFGYVDGAFTGAKKGGKSGLFEAANGGTIFLDEIGEMPLDLQVTLLRVLQENKITRVGGYAPVPVDVRIVAATNKNIMDEIAYNGTFRSDLYYRLSVFQLELIPLRERIDDIPELANFFLEKLNKKNRTQKRFSAKALNLLMAYHWPGNIRELSNIVERSYYLAHFQSVIEGWNLDAYISRSNDAAPIAERKTIVDSSEAEKDLILNHLKETGANVSKVAKRLDMSRTTLYKKMRQYQIEIKR